MSALIGAAGYISVLKLIDTFPATMIWRMNQASPSGGEGYPLLQREAATDRLLRIIAESNGATVDANHRNLGGGPSYSATVGVPRTGGNWYAGIARFNSLASRDIAINALSSRASDTGTTTNDLSYHDTFLIGQLINGMMAEIGVFNGTAVSDAQYNAYLAGTLLVENMTGVTLAASLLTIPSGATSIVCETGQTLTFTGSVTQGSSHPITRTAPDTTAPTVASVAVANGTPSVVNLTMSENMDTGSVPAASAFTVSGHTVSSVAITGNTINLTLSAPFVNGEVARTVAYTQPGTNNARDLATTPNLLANFTGLAITNNVAAPGDTTAPGFSLAQVLNSAPAQIVITMNETLAAFTPAASAFAVSGGKTVSSVARSGATITLTCSSAYAYGDTITVTYTKPGANMLQDVAGNQTNSFGPNPVTNGIAAPGGALVTLPGPLCRFPGGMPLVSESGKFQFLSKTDLSAAPLANVAKTTSSTGTVTPWTQTGLTAGVAVRCRFISDVDAQESECDVTPS